MTRKKFGECIKLMNFRAGYLGIALRKVLPRKCFKGALQLNLK